MQKYCSRCGDEMSIMLRNVVYRNRVKITNVPVHVCLNHECAHSQVVDVVKDDLKNLMNELGNNPPKQSVQFDRFSEFSNLLILVADQDEDIPTKHLIEERINELLDMFLLAQSLGDEKWMGELRKRLMQIMHV